MTARRPGRGRGRGRGRPSLQFHFSTDALLVTDDQAVLPCRIWQQRYSKTTLRGPGTPHARTRLRWSGWLFAVQVAFGRTIDSTRPLRSATWFSRETATTGRRTCALKPRGTAGAKEKTCRRTGEADRKRCSPVFAADRTALLSRAPSRPHLRSRSLLGPLRAPKALGSPPIALVSSARYCISRFLSSDLSFLLPQACSERTLVNAVIN